MHGTSNAGEYENRDFRTISRRIIISETIQDRDIITTVY